MCILFVYRNPKAGGDSYRLILASNRDEAYARPTLPAHYWERYSGCLGGTDMEPGKEGGTWLALSLKGKAGVILNLANETGATEPARKGRGFLIRDYITSTESASQYLNRLHKENRHGQPYNPYSLILVDLFKANTYYLNSAPSSRGLQSCQENILGFGNSGSDTPYRKVTEGKEKFKSIVKDRKTSQQESLIDDLIQFLKSTERHLPDPELRKRCPNTYEEISSIFVTSKSKEYGTRTHSILLVTGANELTYVEETLMPDATWKRQYFNHNLSTENGGRH